MTMRWWRWLRPECPRCSGHGFLGYYLDKHPQRCPVCGGRGSRWRWEEAGDA